MTLLYFTATWCQPCKRFGPIMDEIAKDTGVVVEKFDADEDAMYIIEHQVVSVPTVIKIDEFGNEVARVVGARPKAVALRELAL